MRTFNPPTILIAIVVLLTASTPAPSNGQANLIASFFVDNFYFSPNGDGTQDFTTISYNLVDSAAVDVVILEKDSVTVVTALISDAPTPVGGTNYQVVWDGRDSFGTVVAEDSFLVFLRASNTSGVDSSYIRVFVDLNRPQASITQVFPTFFVPDSPDTNAPDIVQLSYNIADPLLNDSVFVNAALFDPSGAGISTFVNAFVFSPAGYQNVWDGSGAVDGIYEFRIEVRDKAGNIDQNGAEINVDIDAPDIASTNGFTFGSSSNTNPPDVLEGYAWDRNGLTSLEMKFFDTGVWEPVPNTIVRDDTSFFSIAIADSLPGDGNYELRLRATDPATRVTESVVRILIDTTAPDPPVITSKSEVLRTSKYIVKGTASILSAINVYRNGSLVTGNLADASGVFEIDVLLLPRKNTIYVTEQDAAQNESGPSNSIVVEFDVTTGVTIGQPLRPNEPIIVILPEDAQLVKLFIYDLAGDLVEELVQTHVGSNYVFRWNGLNGDNIDIKRGPLVAVIRVEFLSGRHEMIREAFLWDPN